jgi:tyrosyl-tRNA synthetase
LSEKTLSEIAELKEQVTSGTLHPKVAKELLASEIVTRFHDSQSAETAKEEFNKVHKQNELPTDMEEFSLTSPIWIAKALVDTKLENSTSQARRDIKQGAVKIDQVKVEDEQLQLESGEYVLQVGKRKFAKVKVS